MSDSNDHQCFLLTQRANMNTLLSRKLTLERATTVRIALTITRWKLRMAPRFREKNDFLVFFFFFRIFFCIFCFLLLDPIGLFSSNFVVYDADCFQIFDASSIKLFLLLFSFSWCDGTKKKWYSHLVQLRTGGSFAETVFERFDIGMRKRNSRAFGWLREQEKWTDYHECCPCIEGTIRPCLKHDSNVCNM